MKKFIIITILSLLCLYGNVYAQRGASRQTLDTLKVSVLRFQESDRDSIDNPVNGMMIMDSSANDSIFLYHLSEWINITSFLSQDTLFIYMLKNAFNDSIGVMDSTYITNNKIGIGDINNLWALINERLYKNDFNDSTLVMDSTYITNNKIGIEDINNLLTFLNEKLYKNNFIDSLRIHKSPYLNILYNFSVDTSLTISQNDSVDIFYDIDDNERVIVARAKDDAEGIQNATFESFFEVNEDITGIDTLSVLYKTSHDSTDSNKVNVYTGTVNRLTGVITITDSSTNNANTSYTRVGLYLGDNTVNKNSIVIIRFRFWSINETKMIRIKRPYLVTK